MTTPLSPGPACQREKRREGETEADGVAASVTKIGEEGGEHTGAGCASGVGPR